MVVKVIDTTNTKDADQFGEILREYAFKERFGCYTTFEVEDEFIEVSKSTELGIKLLELLGFNNDSYNSAIKRKDERTEDMCINIRDNSHMFSNGQIHLAWHWDGDGHLVFIEGERIAENRDCKKDYNWKWVK